MVRFSRFASTANYPLARVANLLRRRPQYGANERGLDRTDSSQIRYIRITDVDSLGRLAPGLGATAEVTDSRYLLNDGDILLARSGNTAGKSYIYSAGDGPAIFAGYMIRFAFDPAKVDPTFAFIYTQLPVYHLWVQATRRLTGQPNINAEEYRSLTIPIPPDEVQNKIICQYGRAREAYKRAAAEAAALLASIDDYLLSELGITLPPETENTLADRTFRVSAHELGSARFDPLFHAFKMWHAIENSGMPSARLGAICTSVKTGFAAGGKDQAEGDGGIIQIRPTNIDSDRRLKFDRNIYVSAGLATQRPREILKPGEVLFNNTNSQALVGKTTFFDLSDQLYTCSNHITRLTVNPDQAIPEYLTAILNLYQRRKAFFSICTNWNNQSGVGADLLRKIVVPVPDMSMQRNIVEQITATFSKAATLKANATRELETAKSEIEAILLGGAT